jgi:RNA polymerase sigma factor (sigma-70 family)
VASTVSIYGNQPKAESFVMGDREWLETSDVQKVRLVFFNYFYSLVRNREDAEDLAHMALEKLLSAPDKTRVRHFNAYVWAVVRNVLMDFFRGKERDGALREHLETAAMLREAAEFARDSFTGEVRATYQLTFLKQHMKETWWLALCLRVRDGLSDLDIGMRLGVGESTVRKYIAKARAVINQLIRSH